MSNPSNRPATYLGLLLALLVFGFSSVWLYSAEVPNAFMDSDYGQWTAKMAMIRHCDVGDMAVIGDSRASAGIVPAILSPRDVRNLALTGTTPLEGYYEIAHILSCPKPPKTILLSFAPRQYGEINWFWLHAARYGFFSFPELEDVRHSEKELGISLLYKGEFGTEPPGVMQNWLYTHAFPPFNFASMLAAEGFRRGVVNNAIRQDTLAHDGQHLEGTAACTKLAGWEATQHEFVVAPLVKVYLDRLVQDALAHRIRLYIVFPPISELTAKSLSPDYEAGFENFLASEQKLFPALHVIGQAFPVMDNCAFGDEHHLNQKGAESFTKTLSAMLPEAGS